MPSRATVADVAPEVAALVARYHLSPDSRSQLVRFVELLLSPHAPTAVRTPQAAVDDHLADALVALELDALRSAHRLLDLGSGAGLPGLPLAIARPEAAFTLLEAGAPKVRFLKRACDECLVANADVVHARAESFARTARPYDLVTARAVGPLPVVLEYAAPLLGVGGTLVVWRGRRDPDAEAAAAHAAEQLGLGTATIRPVAPYDGAEHRHLYTVSKLEETPVRFPRRPGMALKRPLGLRDGPCRAPSDRVQR
ncbi:MAG TPA: 16S rRNA (guanine(527)-N(7))-methyltransferase RsmG [Solirubrobacteraceae bacterium]|nr:16S rRNA (guanine(527)-N(7))-methyltransferase RsmG [Solirubrobacteraceae bacterium]